jgi:hypothetical protein
VNWTGLRWRSPRPAGFRGVPRRNPRQGRDPAEETVTNARSNGSLLPYGSARAASHRSDGYAA